MLEFKKSRLAYFGDETKPTKVLITISKSLPMINLSGTSGIGGVKYSQSVQSEELPAVPAVHETLLYDFDDVGVKRTTRYIFIAVIPSLITKSRGFLYHDTINKDLFIIPDTELYHGDTDSDAYLENNLISIVATHIGSHSTLNGVLTDNLTSPVPINENDMSNFTVVNPLLVVNVHLLVLPGLDVNSPFNNFGFVAGDHYYESKRNAIVQFVSLGSSTALFDANTKVPLHKIVCEDFINHGLRSIGNRKCGDILIPVNF